MAKRFAIYQEKYRGLLVDQANAVTEDSKKVDPRVVLLCFANKYYRSDIGYWLFPMSKGCFIGSLPLQLIRIFLIRPNHPKGSTRNLCPFISNRFS